MEIRLIAAGLGGQGVLLIGQLLCQAAVLHDKRALYLPKFGMEMRGGDANCQVILSDSEIGAPITRRADVLIAMSEDALRKFQDHVRKEGSILINENLISRELVRRDVSCIAVQASALAEGLGSLKAVNMVMLGAFAEHTGFFTRQEMMETVRERFSAKPQFLEINLSAVQVCMKRSGGGAV